MEYTLLEIIIASTMPLSIVAVFIYRAFARKKDGAHFGIGKRMIQVIAICLIIPVFVLLSLKGILGENVIIGFLGTLIGYLFTNFSERDE